MQPDNSHALFRKGLAHHSLKQYHEAAVLFEEAKKADPINPRVVVDYNSLHSVHVIELCRPGTERTDAGLSALADRLKVCPVIACHTQYLSRLWPIIRDPCLSNWFCRLECIQIPQYNAVAGGVSS
eukprot:scaffold71465_cov18-Prasinocladus_malaysianus.AAC.1